MIQVVKARGILEGSLIRLKDVVNLPSGTEVDITIEPSREAEAERRKCLARRILERRPIDIRPLTVRNLIDEGREE